MADKAIIGLHSRSHRRGIFDNDTRVDLNPRAGIRAFWDAKPAAAGTAG